MKTKFLILIITVLLTGLAFSCSPKKELKDTVPLAPEQYRRPKNLQLSNYKYSLEDLKNKFSDDMMKRAASRMETVNEVNKKGHWKPTPESIDTHTAPEWFVDAKFGMFIDWGIWSVAGWGKKQTEGTPTYPDWYEYLLDNYYPGLDKDSSTMKYHEKNWGSDFHRDDFILLFKASNYQPDKLAEIAVEAGMKYVIPFTKHCSGFCLWPSSFTQRDASDMGPKTDLVKPLLECCRQKGLKFGFYLCAEEWEYPIIDDNGNIVNRKPGGVTIPYSKDLEKKASGKIPVKNFATDYLAPLATEFIDVYDPDILWFDSFRGDGLPDVHSYEIASYFYNNAQGRKEVAVNDRYIVKDIISRSWLRGDFFTSEYNSRDKQPGRKEKSKIHVWEENQGISQSFGYNWQDTENNVISTEKFINMFVDIVSQGGNFCLIVNLDGQGALPEIQEKRLKDIGKWLKVNGEGIYGTRTYSTTSEGTVRYTRSKDHQKVYAINTEWPGHQLKLKSITPKAGSQIYLLGVKEALKWSYDQKEGLITIEIPENLQEESNRPCQYAYTFKIDPK